MTKPPLITSIHLLPEKAGWNSVDGSPREIVSIGLALDNGQIYWGDCVDPVDIFIPDQPEDFKSDDIVETLQNTVIPALRGLPITDIRSISKLLSALNETVTVTRQVWPDVETPKSISRRDFLTGWLKPDGDSPEPETIKETFLRPIHPSIRYGVSLAFLRAVSAQSALSPAQVISNEWELEPGKGPVPIQFDVTPTAIQFRAAARLGLSSVRYPFVPDPSERPRTPIEILNEGLRIAKKEYLMRGVHVDDAPVIQIDSKGMMGILFDNNPGKILGALFGMEKAFDPFRLRIETPIIETNPETEINLYNKVFDYLKMRRMRTQLVFPFHDGILSAANDNKLNKAVMVQVRLATLGELGTGVEAVKMLKTAGYPVMMSGGNDESLPLLAQIAAALNPDLLSVSGRTLDGPALGSLQLEMKKTITSWL